MAKQLFDIKYTCKSTRARVACLSMLHGEVRTPIFLPVGTQATVRALTPQDLNEIGIKMVLCNAYHLYLRPGIDTVVKAGGLHRFMAWDKPMLTDSGGYQIFSLASFRNITDDGVTFRSHIDGSEHRISPETAIRMQEVFGADIIMALDVCPESTAGTADMSRAVEITASWAERCRRAHGDTGQHLFGIIQGGLERQLRERSARQLASLDFPGYAIGGLSLGESKADMWDIVHYTVEYMPEDKPRYLMGVGSPEDFIEGVSRGIDIFDSALPTRVARNGALFTRKGRLNIKKSHFKNDSEPVEATCGCYTCRNFTAAYLNHLFRCEELLAYRLATIHNLFFMQKLVEEIREAIEQGKFPQFREQFLASYKTTDEELRVEQKLRNVKIKRDRGILDFQ